MAGAGGRPASYSQEAVERVVEELEAEGGIVDAARVKERLVARGEATPGARLEALQPRIERHLAEREEARRAAWRQRVPEAMRAEVAGMTEGLTVTFEVLLGRLHEGLEEQAGRRVEEVEGDKRAHARRADHAEDRLAEAQEALAEAAAARDAVRAERDAAREEARGLSERLAEAAAERDALRARAEELEGEAADAGTRLGEAEHALAATRGERDAARTEARRLGDDLKRAEAEAEGLRSGLDRSHDLVERLMRRLDGGTGNRDGEAGAASAKDAAPDGEATAAARPRRARVETAPAPG